MSLPAQRADRTPLSFWNSVEILEFNPNEVIYKACLTARCSKKVDPVVGGGWMCSRCSKQTEFGWRFSMKMKVRDSTQEMEAAAFGDVSMTPDAKMIA